MMAFNATEYSKLYINNKGLFKLTKIDERDDEIVAYYQQKRCSFDNIPSHNYDVSTNFVKNNHVVFSRKVVANLMAKNHQFSFNF